MCVSGQAVQVFSDWLTQTVRVYAGQPYVEVEWIVGPVPIDDNNVRGGCVACALDFRVSLCWLLFVVLPLLVH